MTQVKVRNFNPEKAVNMTINVIILLFISFSLKIFNLFGRYEDFLL